MKLFCAQVEAYRHSMHISVLNMLSTHMAMFSGDLPSHNPKLLEYFLEMVKVDKKGLRDPINKAIKALVKQVTPHFLKVDVVLHSPICLNVHNLSQ